ncbi:complement C1q tumor necrosis factor-related protein 4-like [Mytilus edulis]|uniref:complement C1q tumor necrosis factor-related protein 4-like n=1 Tax=Mytilus edulis TaxID=6550 RepID=UPI0039F01009
MFNMLLWIFCAATFGVAYGQDVSVFTKGFDNDGHITKGSIVTYPKHITNFNAKFTSDGKFHVQVPGIYVFHFYALSYTSSDSNLMKLYRNGMYLVSIYDDEQKHNSDAAGNTVILQLERGDTVYVQALDSFSFNVYGRVAEIYVTFTGGLIFSGRSSASNPVAMTAGLTHDVSLPNGGTVVFNKVFTNLGNGYDSTTGYFVAPTDGVFLIHYFARSQSGHVIFLDLYKNTIYVNSAWGQLTHRANAGNSAILDMRTGDTLSIRGRSGEAVALSGQPTAVYCTFSIMKLSEQNTAPSGLHANQIQAFSAVLTKKQNEGRHTTKVVWDKLYSNHGGNFNMSTGIFTASVPGVYIFSYHALSQEGQPMWLELYHNYVYVNSLYGSGHLFSYGSNSAALKLALGDIVYIDMKNHNTGLFGAADEIYGSFSGYLLVPMDGTSIAGR